MTMFDSKAPSRWVLNVLTDSVRVARLHEVVPSVNQPGMLLSVGQNDPVSNWLLQDFLFPVVSGSMKPYAWQIKLMCDFSPPLIESVP